MNLVLLFIDNIISYILIFNYHYYYLGEISIDTDLVEENLAAREDIITMVVVIIIILLYHIVMILSLI